MNLSFSVNIEVDGKYGEGWVEYIRYLMTKNLERVGLVSISYISVMDEKTAETIELDAYERGKLDL